MSQGESETPTRTELPTSSSEIGWAKGLPMKAGVLMVASMIFFLAVLAYGISTGNNVPFVMIAGLGLMIVPFLIVGLVRAGRIK